MFRKGFFGYQANWCENIIRGMKKSHFFLLILVSLVPLVSVSAATLQNTDQQIHLLEIRAAGRFYEYTILDQTTISDICEYGCEMVLISSGQTVKVNPNDTVVIDNGVLQVKSGNGQ